MSRARISVVLITQSSSEYVSVSAFRKATVCELNGQCRKVLPGTERRLTGAVGGDGTAAIISVVGDGMRTLRGISAKFLPRWPAPTSILSPLLRDLLKLNLCRGQ